MTPTITVAQLIKVLDEVKDKDIPVYIAEQKKVSNSKNGVAVYKAKNKYPITSGGEAFTAFILGFDKDNKI